MTRIVWIGVVALVVLGGCVSREAAYSGEEELLQLQALQRRAHLEENADLLTSIFADSFISVENGAISRPSRQESRARFQAYFDGVEFLAWEDITPPIIRVSGDGTLGHVLVHKRVRLRDPASGRESETEFAWMETYEKRGGEWRLTTVVSTQRPADGG